MDTAKTIHVYIPDIRKYGVPGSELPIWRYREEVDPNWEPGPDYPGVVTEALPTRRGNMAAQAIEENMKLLFPEAHQPVFQLVSDPSSLDMRPYTTSEWVNAVWDGRAKVSDGYYKPLPPELHRPVGAAGSMFLNTVHFCFSNHHPLGIRPDALMWMVLHEVGITVRLHPEAYRYLFTDSDQKKLIDVQANEIDLSQFNQNDAWAYGIALLTRGLESKMPSELLRYMLPEISTHDLGSLTASYVAALNAATPYYDMLMRVCCGIPDIRLFGAAADYDNILEACKMLAEIFSEHLGKYFEYLIPVLQEIADTVSGRKEVDNGFWASIYNHYSGSGVDDMDGWITAFVNYKFHTGTPYPKEDHLYNWKANLEKSKKYGRGIHREDIPCHLSAVPFVLNYAKDHSGQVEGEFAGTNFKAANQGNGANFDCRLVGGFLSVQDVDGYATPTLGFAVIRGDELTTHVDKDGWSVQPEGRDPIRAKKRPVHGFQNGSGRIDVE